MTEFIFEETYCNNGYIFVAYEDDWYEPNIAYLWIEFEGEKKCLVDYYYDNDDLNAFWEKVLEQSKRAF